MASCFKKFLPFPRFSVTYQNRESLLLTFRQRVCFATSANVQTSSKSNFSKYALVLGGLGLGGGLYGYLAAPERKRRPETTILTEKLDFSVNENIPAIKASREVSGPNRDLEFDLEIYQYQTCPFCCKVRAYLDFYGIPYKVVEVNPVMRQQLKFSKYKKVPIVITKDKKSSQKHQLNDSSVIISILGTCLTDIFSDLESVLKYYLPVTYKSENGKETEDVLNKYFIMYGDKMQNDNTDKFLMRERDWRKWADDEFVHVLSPNIYRSYDEALQAFNYFSEVGEWEKNFSALERLIVIYVGATAMYFVGKKLRKKYSLNEDVRLSLYEACHKWTTEIGTLEKFHGGNVPNLADLSVYGMLSSIEGCTAFQDLLNNTNIGTWYFNVKNSVKNHDGYNKMLSK